MNDPIYVSFHCYYETNTVTKSQYLPLSDIGKWIDCYRFTHPECFSVSVKVWFPKSVSN